MPLHDWSSVPAGLFHHFHQDYTIELARELNRGRLPVGLSALVEQRAGVWEPDCLAIESHDAPDDMANDSKSVVIAEQPKTRFVVESDKEIYRERANRIVVRHHLGRIVSVIEVVSPGNKSSKAALRDFVEKTIHLLQAGVHVLIVDFFPPTPRDPDGIHQAIWNEFDDDIVTMPSDKNRIVVSYETGRKRVAYIEPVAVGDSLPDMPLFVSSDLHITVPLEAAYNATWTGLPAALRESVIE